MGADPAPESVESTHRACRESNGFVGCHGGEIRAGVPPNDRVVHPGAAHAQDEVAGRQVHILDGFVGTALHHPSYSRHAAHAGPEFQIAFFFDEDSAGTIQAVLLPDGSVFDRVIILQGKPLANLQRQHQQRRSILNRDHPQFQAAGCQAGGKQ